MPLQPSFPEPTYGSDADGLIWGYLFKVGSKAEPIDAARAATWLEQKPPGEFVWLHFQASNTAALSWMTQHLALPLAFLEGMDASSGSTSLALHDGVLVAFLQDVLFDFRFDATEVAAVSFAVQEQILVSTRVKPLRSVDRLRGCVKVGQLFQSTVELFAQLLREQADVLTEIIRSSTAQVDQAEDALLSGSRVAKRAKLSSLRRMLVRFQRLLAPEPAALFRLLNRPPVWIAESDMQDLRQAAEEFSRAVADCLALGERIRLVQEELAALGSEKTNENLFLLTFVTVLAIPFNVVGALFGMNVGGIPFAESPHGFWLVVLWVGGVTAAAAWLALRRR